ncbi:MAG: L-fuculose-phosphate aldolase [Oscillospiraceae bacterium]|nr:L-fuculose-phosphate aldolase [Oscillospiraceae bacterium]
MLLKEERELIVQYGKKLLTEGLVRGTGGNISIFDRQSGLMAITPGGMDYMSLTPDDIVVMTLGGNDMHSSRKPSSEWRMHAGLYAAREDFSAVVHTHSPAAAAVASLRIPLPAVNYLTALASDGEIPCADYAVFGSRELAENAVKAMEKSSVCFLANHGLLAAADSLPKAFSLAGETEFCCDVYLRAKAAGEPVALTKEQIAQIRESLKGYGQ